MTTTSPDCATLPIPTLAALAEELCNADKFPQYRGKFDDHVRVRITRNVTTKSGRAFFKGEITIAKQVDYGDGLDWSCVCWRTPVARSLGTIRLRSLVSDPLPP